MMEISVTHFLTDIEYLFIIIIIPQMTLLNKRYLVVLK